jgi:hypothetical protein
MQNDECRMMNERKELMLYETPFPVGGIEEQELRALVEQLSKISGAKVELSMQITVSTDDVNLNCMFETLRDTIHDGRAKARPLKKGRTPKMKIKKMVGGVKPEPTRGPHVRSIKVNGSGEMISRFELNKRLAAHEIMPGTQLHSPKYGNVTVRNGGLEGTPYMIVNEAGEPV